MTHDHHCDVLVIGAGVAGLSLALRLADRARIAVIAKGALTEGASRYAQGGIAAAVDAGDSVESHVADTLDTGSGLCDEEIVRFTVEQGPACIQWLVDLGVPFTRRDGADHGNDLHLTREGGHSHRRVIHAADHTGRESTVTLARHARNHPQIDIFEQHVAVDLITGKRLGLSPERCLGVYTLDRTSHSVRTFTARTVVLATGGASAAYLYTTNPSIATGDGIAMAWRAGCRVANMEFIQFHPTCLYHPLEPHFLMTEAIRGEGGRLLLPDGTRFVQRFDPRGELAPRDIVARAIDHEMKRLGLDYVELDISHKPAEFIRERFPTIHARCLELGLDITNRPIPVVPAAHYTCGGIMTDRHGRTDLQGLYAIGETAHTGLHGANRLASNSLLECLVFAASAAKDIDRCLDEVPDTPSLPPWDESRVTDSDEEVVISHNWKELRHIMWDYVGIVRTDKRLQRAARRVELLQEENQEYYGNFRVTNNLIELRNLVVVAGLIIRSALQRKESRGLHYTLDHPTPIDRAAQTVLNPGEG